MITLIEKLWFILPLISAVALGVTFNEPYAWPIIFVALVPILFLSSNKNIPYELFLLEGLPSVWYFLVLFFLGSELKMLRHISIASLIFSGPLLIRNCSVTP